jgi:hypothetical protein
MAKISDEKCYQIATHLQKRFKERHNIELNRNARLMLIKQIKSGYAKKLYSFSETKGIYRVYLYNNARKCDLPYHVIYDSKLEQILTVLPSKDSEEYKEFFKKHNIDINYDTRYMTPQERTQWSIDRYREHQIKQEKIKVGLNRLNSWKRLKEYKNSIDIQMIM